MAIGTKFTRPTTSTSLFSAVLLVGLISSQPLKAQIDEAFDSQLPQLKFEAPADEEVPFDPLSGESEVIYTPDSFYNFRGWSTGNLKYLSSSDELHLLGHPGFVLNPCEYRLAIIFDFTLATDQPLELSFATEVHANSPGLRQKYHFFNWTTGFWDEDSPPCLCCFGPWNDVAYFKDSVVTFDLSDRIPDVVEPGSGRVRVATGWYKSGLIIAFPWEISLDHVFVTTIE